VLELALPLLRAITSKIEKLLMDRQQVGPVFAATFLSRFPEMSSSERERLLSLLEAHGHAFLKSIPTNFDSLNDYPTTNNKRRRSSKKTSNYEEWHGIKAYSPGSSHQYGKDQATEIGIQILHWSIWAHFLQGSFEYSDDEFIADSSSAHIVVFSDATSKKQETLSKSFMVRRTVFSTTNLTRECSRPK
jgi:hypothetical protein